MNLSTTIDFDLKAFFQWWGRGLAFWIPEKLKQLLSDKSDYVFLSTSTESLIFFKMIDGKKQSIVQIAFNDKNQTDFRQLITENADLNKAQYILRLNADQAIKKILYLPAAAKENLRQVVAFEMDRYTPFKAEQVYFSLKPMGKEEGGQIKLLLIVTPKKILDSIFQQLNDLSIYPGVVDYEPAANYLADGLSGYNLLPKENQPAKNKITQFSITLIGFILLLLSATILIYPVWHEGKVVDSLRYQLKQLEKDSNFVQSRQLEIDAIVDKTSRLINAKNNAPSLIELFNSLTQLMPDKTWLNYLQYKETKLQIKGQSPSASVLIGILEASPLFNNARFVSPLTQDRLTGMERFQIDVDVTSTRELDNE